ncbi:uncharacterized protein LOC129599300 [Paramacrobiotus metropolitanus]|uniref:uncharacterized protein LOC129599300 n=1 Tax=Paramacrobiotus metropolitanus TaxID=2943436 RepID=UPI0024456DF5|nr:uncharacterized protein LOC129599300 [Paramacrobiotus metropolitanus]
MDRHFCLLKCAGVVLFSIYMVLSLDNFHSSACPTAIQKACHNITCYYTIATLERIVQNATRNPASDKIHLAFELHDRSAFGSFVQAVRVDSGASASLACAVHNVTFSTPQELPEIYWTINQRMLASLRNGRLTSPGVFDLNHSTKSLPLPTSAYANVTVTLTLKNVSWRASGDVVCSQLCHLTPVIRPVPVPIRTGSVGKKTFCTSYNQYFRLLVFPSASELFPIPLANITVLRWSDTNISCVVNRLDAGNIPSFIWRFNGRVIAAPADHPLHALASAVVDRRGGSGPAEYFPLYNISTAKELKFAVSSSSTATTSSSTLFISRVDLHTSARVECWVRPDDSQEVWRRQIAYLHVETTPAA